MSGCILTREQLAGLAALETTQGSLCVMEMGDTIRLTPDDFSRPCVVAVMPPRGWLAPGDPTLLAAAPDLLATALDRDLRILDLERRLDLRESALSDAGADLHALTEEARELGTDAHPDDLRAFVSRLVDVYAGAAGRAVVEERDEARAEVAELRSLVDSYDSRLTMARVALDAAGAPDVEPPPDGPCSDYKRSLQAGGRVLPLDERVGQLAGERDALRAEVAELRAALAEAQTQLDIRLTCMQDLRRLLDSAPTPERIRAAVLAALAEVHVAAPLWGDAVADDVLARLQASEPRREWIVQLEPGVWLAPWKGDPGRTCERASARRFGSERAALRALERARRFRKLPVAVVEVA